MATDIRIGRILWDANGTEWKVIRLRIDRGEAILFDPVRKVTRTYHPVHDRGELEVVA